MKRKFLSMLLALSMVLTLLPTTAAAAGWEGTGVEKITIGGKVVDTTSPSTGDNVGTAETPYRFEVDLHESVLADGVKAAVTMTAGSSATAKGVLLDGETISDTDFDGVAGTPPNPAPVLISEEGVVVSGFHDGVNRLGIRLDADGDGTGPDYTYIIVTVNVGWLVDRTTDIQIADTPVGLTLSKDGKPLGADQNAPITGTITLSADKLAGAALSLKLASKNADTCSVKCAVSGTTPTGENDAAFNIGGNTTAGVFTSDPLGLNASAEKNIVWVLVKENAGASEWYRIEITSTLTTPTETKRPEIDPPAATASDDGKSVSYTVTNASDYEGAVTVEVYTQDQGNGDYAKTNNVEGEYAGPATGGTDANGKLTLSSTVEGTLTGSFRVTFQEAGKTVSPQSADLTIKPASGNTGKPPLALGATNVEGDAWKQSSDGSGKYFLTLTKGQTVELSAGVEDNAASGFKWEISGTAATLSANTGEKVNVSAATDGIAEITVKATVGDQTLTATVTVTVSGYSSLLDLESVEYSPNGTYKPGDVGTAKPPASSEAPYIINLTDAAMSLYVRAVPADKNNVDVKYAVGEKDCTLEDSTLGAKVPLIEGTTEVTITVSEKPAPARRARPFQRIIPSRSPGLSAATRPWGL